MLVQVEARPLQVQTELLPLERVDVPGGRVTVAVDHTALALTTETQAGPLQHHNLYSHSQQDNLGHFKTDSKRMFERITQIKI